MALKTRLEIQEYLEGLLESGNVYYQPPETLKMKYPCIVYNIQNMSSTWADDAPYRSYEVYLVTSITKEADDPMVPILINQRGFSFDRHYVADNLHHNVFRLTIY